jgi:hypothetical protein
LVEGDFVGCWGVVVFFGGAGFLFAAAGFPIFGEKAQGVGDHGGAAGVFANDEAEGAGLVDERAEGPRGGENVVFFRVVLLEFEESLGIEEDFLEIAEAALPEDIECDGFDEDAFEEGAGAEFGMEDFAHHGDGVVLFVREGIIVGDSTVAVGRVIHLLVVCGMGGVEMGRGEGVCC